MSIKNSGDSIRGRNRSVPQPAEISRTSTANWRRL